MIPHLTSINLGQWIDENRESWGTRRTIWEDSDFIAFVTRGPNSRTDFHIDPADEIFHQLEGELDLHYVDANGQRQVAVLRAGELFLLPANVPHSPRRPEGSWTLVIERKRRPEELDRFVWYCEECGNTLFEAVDRFEGPGDAVARAYQAFQSDPALRTCSRCGSTMELPR